MLQCTPDFIHLLLQVPCEHRANVGLAWLAPSLPKVQQLVVAAQGSWVVAVQNRAATQPAAAALSY